VLVKVLVGGGVLVLVNVLVLQDVTAFNSIDWPHQLCEPPDSE
jgi:hypothetical protein